MTYADLRQHDWSILYRGPLSSCNYACTYCPFAKTRNTRAELKEDADKLASFVQWVEERTDRTFGILFTPWGEALIRKHYKRAMMRLSHMPHVRRVAAQTNLSCSVGWTAQADRDAFRLWATWHPTQCAMDAFVDKCLSLHAQDVRFSVGVVGLKEHYDDIEALRAALPPSIYVWINAYKRDPNYYSEAELERIQRVDPLFLTNTTYHPSRGEACQAGSTSFTVDGEGDVRRCHFIKDPIGNIHDPDFDEVLAPTPCTNDTCGCHIGYVHMNAMRQYDVYGPNVLERIPRGWP